MARPATTLYQHNLTGILETAVRATNAQFDNAEILKRLDVRLLEVLMCTCVFYVCVSEGLLCCRSDFSMSKPSVCLQVSPGDTGWDVFSLDYHVDGPIATVTHSVLGLVYFQCGCSNSCFCCSYINIYVCVSASGVYKGVYGPLPAGV